MAGKQLEGTAEYTDAIENSCLPVKTKRVIDSTITWTFRSKENQTRVTLTIDYHVPFSLLSLISGNISVAG
jgi:ribosome-associated toxin RatA of RatAB toxin-antitoxin module